MTFVSRLNEALPRLFHQRATGQHPHKKIICDCQGTFFDEDSHLKSNIFEFLKQAKDSGYDIVLASNAPAFSQMIVEDLLEDKELPYNFFGEVQAKGTLRGKAFLVIDNDPADQFIGSDHRLLPDDPRIALMTRQLECKKGLLGLDPQAKKPA